MPFPSRFACLHPEYVLNQILICQRILFKVVEGEDDVYAGASVVCYSSSLHIKPVSAAQPGSVLPLLFDSLVCAYPRSARLPRTLGIRLSRISAQIGGSIA